MPQISERKSWARSFPISEKPSRLPELKPSGWAKPLSHVHLLIGFLVGAIGGTLTGLVAPGSIRVAWLLAHVVRPMERTFLDLLLILVVPLLFSSIAGGIAYLREGKSVRRLVLATLACMGTASGLAALLGLAMVNLFRPGDGVAASMGQNFNAALGSGGALGGVSDLLHLHGFMADTMSGSIAEAVQRRFPRVVILAFLVGIAAALMRRHGGVRLIALIQRLFEIGKKLIGFVTRFTPIAVACFMFDLTVMLGWHLLAYLGAYVGVVIAALLIQMIVVFAGMVWMMAGIPPIAFLRSAQKLTLVAFSTSSSNASLPTALQVADEEFGLDPRIAGLVLGIGTIANQCGSAIYTSVTVVYLAQFFSIDLRVGQMALVFGVSMLAGMGTIGIPAGVLPFVATILALLGLPPQAVGIVIGVDRLLDMFRTVVNATGDMALALVLSRWHPASVAMPR